MRPFAFCLDFLFCFRNYEAPHFPINTFHSTTHTVLADDLLHFRCFPPSFRSGLSFVSMTKLIHRLSPLMVSYPFNLHKGA